MRLLLALFVTAIAPCAGTVEARPWTLACAAKAVLPVANGSYPEAPFPVLISPEHGTVNGRPAAITDSLITWTVADATPEGSVSYVIDLKQMRVGVYGSTGTLFAAGACTAPGTGAPAPQTPSPPQSPFNLACVVETLDHRLSNKVSIVVNLAAHTVNGSPASITDTKIRWDDASGKDPATTVVDRMTGGLVVYSRNSLVLQGTCELATSRKF